MTAIDTVKDTWVDSLYPSDLIARMPELAERDLFATPEGVAGHVGKLVALSMEGTSPVSPSILHEPNLEKRWRDKRMASADRELAEKVGPTVARKVSGLANEIRSKPIILPHELIGALYKADKQRFHCIFETPDAARDSPWDVRKHNPTWWREHPFHDSILDVSKHWFPGEVFGDDARVGKRRAILVVHFCCQPRVSGEPASANWFRLFAIRSMRPTASPTGHVGKP
jgi:hypothetical protein